MKKFMPLYTYHQIVFQKDYTNFWCFLWPIFFSEQAFQNTNSNTSAIILFFYQVTPRKALFMLAILLGLLRILKRLWNCFPNFLLRVSYWIPPLLSTLYFIHCSVLFILCPHRFSFSPTVSFSCFQCPSPDPHHLCPEVVQQHVTWPLCHP